MKTYKLKIKKDTSARVTSPGKPSRNYQPSMPKMCKIKADNSPRTMLGKGNNKKPEGLKPKMGM